MNSQGFTPLHILIQNNYIDLIKSIDKNKINPSTNNYLWLVTARPSIVRYTLEKLNFDSCIFIDGDTYTYNSYEKLQKLLDRKSVV